MRHRCHPMGFDLSPFVKSFDEMTVWIVVIERVSAYWNDDTDALPSGHNEGTHGCGDQRCDHRFDLQTHHSSHSYRSRSIVVASKL